MGYEEQFARAVRWYERFRELTDGRAHAKESDNYIDEIYAFFQNCYHLKDWIRNDTSAPAAMRNNVQLENYVTGDQALAICADLCNSQKHLTLSKPPRSGSLPVPGARQWSLNVGSVPVIGLKLSIGTASGSLDAFQIATNALSAWVTYINAQGGAVTMPSVSAAPSPAPPAGEWVAIGDHVDAMVVHGKWRWLAKRNLFALAALFTLAGTWLARSRRKTH